MPGRLLTPDSFFRDFKYKHLLLDTSFFIDASSHVDDFNFFSEQCQNNNITLVTIYPVVYEFIKGSKSESVRRERISLVENYIDSYYLPISHVIFNQYIPELIKKYGQRGAKVSITDLMLGAISWQQSADLCLVTKNSKDFPQDIFTYKSHVLLQNQVTQTLQVYGVFCFKNSQS